VLELTGMKGLFLYLIMVFIFTIFASIPTFAEKTNIRLKQNQDNYEETHRVWKLEISVPTQKPSYPQFYIWDKHQPYLQTSLPLSFANRVRLR
jgi:hypothetical protein